MPNMLAPSIQGGIGVPMASPALANTGLVAKGKEKPLALQLIQGLEGLSTKVAAGFADNPAVRAQKTQQVQLEQQQMAEQKAEWAKQVLENMREALPAYQQAYAQMGEAFWQSALGKNVQDDIDTLVELNDGDATAVQPVANSIMAQIQYAPATEAEKPEFRALANPNTGETMQVDMNDPQAVAGAQGMGFTADAGDVVLPYSPATMAQRERESKAGASSTLFNVDARSVGTIPPGYQLVQDESGSLRMEKIAGGPAAEKEGKQREGAVAAADNVVSAISGARSLAKDSTIPTTGFIGAVAKAVPGTPAYDLNAKLNTIKANVGFEQLNQMRQQSETGGALGQVVVEELRLLQSTIADVDQAQSKKQFLEALDRVENTYLDVIHGKGNRPAAVKEKTIEELISKPLGQWTPDDIKRAEELLAE